MNGAIFDELMEIAPLPLPQRPIEIEQSVEALVRVLLADGLVARRTGPDRLEVSWDGRGSMEWCWLGDLALGRVVEDADPTAWTHRYLPGKTGAIGDTGRAIGRAIRAAVGPRGAV